MFCPRLSRALSGTALAAAVALAPLGAAAEEATFDFYISGIRAGEMTLDIETRDGDYAAASRIDAAGVVGLLVSFYYDGMAEGRLGGDGKVVPRRFVANSKSPRAERHTEIDWKDGTPSRVSVEPPRKSGPDPAYQGGTLDPISAGVAILRDAAPEAVCDTSVDVFDGSRRSRLTLAKPVAEGDALVCAGTYSRLEGEAHTLSSQREYGFEIVFRRNASGVAQLERIETKTNFGLAVVERRG